MVEGLDHQKGVRKITQKVVGFFGVDPDQHLDPGIS